ncbi:MAG: MarC family protein [Vulcanimicrobiaceae bacterium]
MHDIDFLFYTFVTLLAMINPIEAAAAFDSLTAGAAPERQRAIALRSTIVAGVILLGFGLAGAALFKALGISLPAFRIAGGLLLLKVAFNMVFAQQTDSQEASDAKAAARPATDPSVFPLAIPIITGPGALTAIVTLFGKAHNEPLVYLAIALIAVVVMAVTYATMRGSQAITKVLGTTGVDAIGRLVGIVVAAIAIQLVIDGVAEITRGAVITT